MATALRTDSVPPGAAAVVAGRRGHVAVVATDGDGHVVRSVVGRGRGRSDGARLLCADLDPGVAGCSSAVKGARHVAGREAVARHTVIDHVSHVLVQCRGGALMRGGGGAKAPSALTPERHRRSGMVFLNRQRGAGRVVDGAVRPSPTTWSAARGSSSIAVSGWSGVVGPPRPVSASHRGCGGTRPAPRARSAAAPRRRATSTTGLPSGRARRTATARGTSAWTPPDGAAGRRAGGVVRPRTGAAAPDRGRDR